MTKDGEEEEEKGWGKLRSPKKVHAINKPTPSVRHRHYEFLKSDNVEPTGVLDPETDEWLYRLFKPTPDWGG